jgi:glycosyltransferase involved in cell wall biosynthesis
VVTLHDAWWVCERQFLVTGEGKYCGQHKIDMNVCATCVPSLGATVLRNARLRGALRDAALLLAPSRHWRAFYVANGFAADRVMVNENGIALPERPEPNRGPAKLRFGFVAGTEAVKGFPLLKRTFEALRRDDWELVLVNHGLSIGVDSFADVRWRVRGTIRTVPPFRPEDRDAFYDKVDVLLFPSQWPESFGLTVREALARNKWVIATDRGGAAEIIRPGVNGTLIPIGEDIAPFRRAVEDLLDRKPDLRGWINPSRDGLRDFATQAAELHDILAAVAAGARPGQVTGQLATA